MVQNYAYKKGKEKTIIQKKGYRLNITPEKVVRFDNLLYLCTMIRKIRTYGGYFETFMSTLKENEQEKIQ